MSEIPMYIKPPKRDKPPMNSAFMRWCEEENPEWPKYNEMQKLFTAFCAGAEAMYERLEDE